MSINITQEKTAQNNCPLLGKKQSYGHLSYRETTAVCQAS